MRERAAWSAGWRLVWLTVFLLCSVPLGLPILARDLAVSAAKVLGSVRRDKGSDFLGPLVAMLMTVALIHLARWLLSVAYRRLMAEPEGLGHPDSSYSNGYDVGVYDRDLDF